MVGTAIAVDISQYKGTWTNSYANTGEITKIVFRGTGKVDANVWSKCSPQDYDWGWKPCNSYSDGHLSTIYQNDVSVQELTMNMTNISTLAVKVHTRFTDNSGRPATEKTYTLRRLVVQKPQTPKPMDRTTPKPVTNEPTGKY